MKIEQIAICTTGGGYLPALLGSIAQYAWRRPLPNKLPPFVGIDGV